MEYTGEAQKLLISYMLTDADAYTLVRATVKPKYFDDRLRKVVAFVEEHTEKYKTLPGFDLVKTQTEVEIKPYANTAVDRQWFLDSVEDFCRYRAMESAILVGVDLIGQGRGDEIMRMFKDAMAIKIVNDLGSEFTQNPAELLARLSDKSNFISTGWRELDDKLNGGFTRASLNIFAGSSGSGKSLFLQNAALNWVNAGLHVAYVTLELSEDLVYQRLYAMVTGMGTRQMANDTNKAVMLMRSFIKNNLKGSLSVKKFPEAGTNANELRGYLKEYEIKNGHKPDVLVVDYLDLMHPNNSRVDVSNLFAKDKNVSEEMRSLASEWNIPVLTASQLNRSAVAAEEHDQSHIAGGLSKINTADNVMTIQATSKKNDPPIQKIQFIKTRNSDSVNSTLKFDYNPVSMRITDFTGVEAPSSADAGKRVRDPAAPASDKLTEIMERAKRNNDF